VSHEPNNQFYFHKRLLNGRLIGNGRGRHFQQGALKAGHEAIHFIVFLTTGLQPLPATVLHRVRSGVSSCNSKYPLVSLRSSSSCLRLLPRLHFYLSFKPSTTSKAISMTAKVKRSRKQSKGRRRFYHHCPLKKTGWKIMRLGR